MAADAGIFQQYLQPIKSVADYRAGLDAQEQNALQLAASRMQAQQAQQDFADGQTLRTATMEAAGDQNALVKALNAKGLYKQAQAIQANIQSTEKTAAEIAASKAKAGASTAQTEAAKYELEQKKRTAAATRMATFKTPEEALADLQAKIQSGEVTPEQGDQLAQSIPRDPAQFGQWQLGHLRSLLTPQQLIEQGTAKPVAESDGQVKFYRDMNPNSPTYGKVVDGTKLQLQASPEAVMTDARTRSEGAAGRAVTMRGQDLVNARAGEALTFEKTKEANKTGADKASHATEGERKAATLLQRMQSSEAQLEAALKLDPNAAKPALVPQGLNAIGMNTTANALTPENRQKVEAAQLDILDAALTLGTGAAYTKEQLEGYRKSYFPQIGDKPNTIKDKQDRLNNVLAAARIAAGRAAGQVTAPAPAEKTSIASKNAKGWTLHTDAQGNKAYVSPDGKSFEEVR